MMNPIAKQPLIRPRFLLLVSMVVGAAAMRLLPHPPNFTPIGAMALFAGAHFGSRLSAFSVPLLAMRRGEIGNPCRDFQTHTLSVSPAAIVLR